MTPLYIYIYILFHILFITVYHRILNIIPCTVCTTLFIHFIEIAFIC